MFEAELAATRRGTGAVPVIVEVSVDEATDDLDGVAGRWAPRGVDELIVSYVRPPQLGPLLDAAARSATLTGSGGAELPAAERPAADGNRVPRIGSG